MAGVSAEAAPAVVVISGLGSQMTRWPVDFCEKLAARGYATGKADGLIGPDTTDAIRAYQRSIGMVPDGYASIELLQRLR